MKFLIFHSEILDCQYSTADGLNCLNKFILNFIRIFIKFVARIILLLTTIQYFVRVTVGERKVIVTVLINSICK